MLVSYPSNSSGLSEKSVENSFFTLKSLEIDKTGKKLNMIGDIYQLYSLSEPHSKSIKFLAHRVHDIYDFLKKKYYKSTKDFLEDNNLISSDYNDSMLLDDKIQKNLKGINFRNDTLFFSHPEINNEIVFDYITFEKEQTFSRKVNPIHVFTYKYRTYLLGYCYLREKILEFREDHMSNIRRYSTNQPLPSLSLLSEDNPMLLDMTASKKKRLVK